MIRFVIAFVLAASTPDSVPLIAVAATSSGRRGPKRQTAT